MSLLREFLRIDSERRAAHQVVRHEVTVRRSRVEELSAEAKRKRDEIAMLDDGLRRLADDIARVEEEILNLESKRDGHDRDSDVRKVQGVRTTLSTDRREGAKLAQDFRNLRAAFHAERERLLAQSDTGRMMDNYFQIETFLKDSSQPIPDAARKALLSERQTLLAKIGPLVAPPPSPEELFRATIAWAGIDGDRPRSVVAFGFPEEQTPSDPSDLAATLLYGAYASVAGRFGERAPRPKREVGAVVFEIEASGRSPEETALELFLAVEDGLKQASAAVSVRCELIGVFLEPAIASEVFGKGA